MSGESFHEGELLVQHRAGVSEQASRLSGMLAGPDLDGGTSRFLAERALAMLTARDRAGRLWVSPLTGSPGFCAASGSTLRIAAAPTADDPLHGLQPGQPVGLLFVNFAKRRRLRVNGTLARSDPHGLEIDADQAFGNCPQYIQQRHVSPGHPDDDLGPEPAARRSSRLDEEHVRQITRADTFILGTAHPTRGADASHRGGAPGFVRVEHGELWWPDYPGNNMFNSLGNIVTDAAAAMLFQGFGTDDTLQVSGRAAVEWVRPGSPGDDGGTGRRVRLTPTCVVATTDTTFDVRDLVAYPRNPPLT